ncbi:MAG: hypothetical protein K9H64_01265 [Bacteroidales bacterium]|nr:hypothetical protein [Bacteroidales bacterium]MCF8454532.1 hypothetical protein [Bacteroidales bacterium]
MKIQMKRIALICFVLLIFTACGKDKTTTNNDDLLSVKENALSENLFDDVFQQVTDASKTSEDDLNAGSKSTLAGGCATVTLTPFDLVTWPKTLTIDFGPTNCLGTDGKERRGIILVNLTNWYRQSGSVYTVTFDDYYVNDNKIEGTKTVENNGLNTNSNLSFTITVTNGVITKPDNSQVHWSASRTREWVVGEPTWILLDDEYLISGTTDGINSVGDTFAVNINTPLHAKVGCPWIMSGELTIERQNYSDITVDYGNGTCDAQAVATMNGVSYPFSMN